MGTKPGRGEKEKVEERKPDDSVYFFKKIKLIKTEECCGESGIINLACFCIIGGVFS